MRTFRDESKTNDSHFLDDVDTLHFRTKEDSQIDELELAIANNTLEKSSNVPLNEIIVG